MFSELQARYVICRPLRMLATLAFAIWLVLSLTACGNTRALSHRPTEMSVQDTAAVKQSAQSYFANLYAGDRLTALGYGDRHSREDQTLRNKYDKLVDLGAKVDAVKTDSTRVIAIVDGIEQGTVFEGSTESTAVLTTNKIMDRGFVKEDGEWRIDYKTIKSLSEGGYIKE